MKITITKPFISPDNLGREISVWDLEPTNEKGKWSRSNDLPLVVLTSPIAERVFPVLPHQGECLEVWTGLQIDARAFEVKGPDFFTGARRAALQAQNIQDAYGQAADGSKKED